MPFGRKGLILKAGYFLSGAKVTGCAAFNRAKIGGQFAANEVSFSNPDGKAIFAQGAEIKGEVFLIKFPYPPMGDIDFTNANLGHVIFDKTSYPFGVLTLDGTIYPNIDQDERFGDAAPMEGWLRRPKRGDAMVNLKSFMALRKYYISLDLPDSLADAYARMMWDHLLKADEIRERPPFAYRQFARVLDAHGHEDEARAVRIEAQHKFTKRAIKGKSKGFVWPYQLWRWAIRHLIAYGFKPWLIFGWMIGLWGLGWLIFDLNEGQMTPAKERFYLSQLIYEDDGKTIKDYKEISPSDPLPKGYPKYSPLIYALDVMLPVVDFAQETHWRPKNTKGLNGLRWFNRLFLALGWAFSTIAVLGFTGLISDKRQ